MICKWVVTQGGLERQAEETRDLDFPQTSFGVRERLLIAVKDILQTASTQMLTNFGQMFNPGVRVWFQTLSS